jgi:hypothetical protein
MSTTVQPTLPVVRLPLTQAEFSKIVSYDVEKIKAMKKKQVTELKATAVARLEKATVQGAFVRIDIPFFTTASQKRTWVQYTQALRNIVSACDERLGLKKDIDVSIFA